MLSRNSKSTSAQEIQNFMVAKSYATMKYKVYMELILKMDVEDIQL